MFKKITRIGKQYATTIYNSVFNRSIGTIFMLHSMGQDNPNRLSCIRDLNVSPNYLQNLIDRLRPNHDFIQLDELLNRLTSPQGKNIKPFAVFTFDDGYRDNYEHALPFFQKNNVPFSVFLTCNFIDNPQAFNYPFLLERMIWRNEKIRLSDGRCFDCSNEEKKDATYQQLKSYVQSFHYDGFEIEFKNAFSTCFTDELYEDNFLTWQQIYEMQKSGLCMFGSHTMTHCVLSKVPVDALNYELGESKHILEKRLGVNVDYISYPFGWIGDVNDVVVAKTSAFGYSLAFQSYGGDVRKNDNDLLRLKRVMLI